MAGDPSPWIPWNDALGYMPWLTPCPLFTPIQLGETNMDFAAILGLITKAETIASLLITAGQNAAPAWDAVKNLFKDKTKITQADMDATDATLDALLEDFNLEMPPA